MGCLILTSLWQAATERARLPIAQRHRPSGLYVDEVQDFAATPIPWEEMFAQGRKYGPGAPLSPTRTLDRSHRELREVISKPTPASKAVFALSHRTRSHGAHLPRARPLLICKPSTPTPLPPLSPWTSAQSPPVTLNTPPPPEPVGGAEQARAASREHDAPSRVEIELAARARLRPRTQSSLFDPPPIPADPTTPWSFASANRCTSPSVNLRLSISFLSSLCLLLPTRWDRQHAPTLCSQRQPCGS